ncbi:hypothetical protein AAFC00_006051 [Neodothiora populina]|uniref:MFS general substrate transporter n=1 Tax=Neodothiora populina TaxID=2781224 RepID=A0ABR3P6W9_9PEZI
MGEVTREKPLHEVTTSHSVGDGQTETVHPTGWKYKQPKIGPLKLPWYASPMSQLVLVAFVCFLCPGMFNALSGMGGGGQVDPSAADKANVALYSTFAVVGFFAGTVVNAVGVKAALSFGGIGYCVYVASFLCYNHTQNNGFNIFAGALLGACAGCLWSAQGVIMMSYPGEANKGRYISLFWMIFNLGSVIGSLIPLGQNIHVTEKSTVSDGTYIGFLVLTFLGACLAWTLVDAKQVLRPDGTKVVLMKNPTWKSELLGLYETLRDDPWVLLLFPMFFSSNWFYTYHFNEVNSAYFNTRTRALNGVLYWAAQIVGAGVFGLCLDLPFRRTLRARGGWIVLFILTMVIWGGGYDFQKGYTRADTSSKSFHGKDWADAGYVGPMFLYLFYGFYDAAWQTCVYWFMGALTNNGRKLANYAGFYKGIQSVGAAIVWRLDDLGVPYMNMFASCWGLLTASLLIALPLIIVRVTDHVEVEEDLKFSDEAITDVVVAPGVVAAHDLEAHRHRPEYTQEDVEKPAI